jgi:hypothetical protein
MNEALKNTNVYKKCMGPIGLTFVYSIHYAFQNLLVFYFLKLFLFWKQNLLVLKCIPKQQ